MLCRLPQITTLLRVAVNATHCRSSVLATRYAHVPLLSNHIKYCLCRDAKSPVSGGRLPYLDVHYSFLYGRTYLPFSPFTCSASGGDCHTDAGKLLSCCWTAKRTLVYFFMQFSRTLAIRETLHDC